MSDPYPNRFDPRPLAAAVGLGLLGLSTWPPSATAAPGSDGLTWESKEGYRSAVLKPAGANRVGFTSLLPNQTGVTFSNGVDEASVAHNRVLLDGSGVALGDYDGDGRPDIFLCSLQGRNTLYRNLGDWRFADVTDASGLVRDNRAYRGAVFADLNGDGALDLLVSVLGGGVECYLNDGRGHFSSATAAARTAGPYGSMTMALADVDGNGTLDLYVANNRVEDIRDRGQANLRMVNGQLTVPPELKDRLLVVNGQVLEYGEPDQLYLNDGHARFTPVSWTGGRFRTEDGGPLTAAPLDWGLTATFRDINGDGYPDLYVCNDFWTPDRIWLNDGKGRFRAAPRLAFRNTSASSMGVDFADVDRDGQMDCFVVDMMSRDPRLRNRQSWAQPPMASPMGVIENRPQLMRNTLFQNRGDGTYAEVANAAGVAAADWAWSPIFLDVDLDGYEDLLITSGHAKDVQDRDAQAQIRARQHPWTGFANEADRQAAFTKELMEHMRLYPLLEMPIVAYRNWGAEAPWQFVEMTESWGTGGRGVHHGIATADLDGDGDLDLVVNNLGGPAGLYRNDGSAARVAVRLNGAAPNGQGIGARVTLIGGAVPRQTQEVISGGRYLAGSDPELVFAAGSAVEASGFSLEVAWRSGRQSRIAGVQPNRVYEISEPAGSAPSPSIPTSPTGPVEAEPFFADLTAKLRHRHVEAPFDDFAKQPLLPFKRSQQGPGVAWFDLDGDHREELIIATGRGGQLGVFQVSEAAEFVPVPIVGEVVPDDVTSLVGWVSASGKRFLLGGLAGYEDPKATGLAAWQWNEGKVVHVPFPNGPKTGVGALAAADFDGDGDLDLFVAGGIVPGRYPEAHPSQIWRCTGESISLDAENTRVLAGVGLVNGAVWSDLDDDGWPELVLACEWGPIRVFANHGGHLEEVTVSMGLAGFTGWWTGVTTGDFDGDGKLDIAAANWGVNSPYVATTSSPVRCYYGDPFGSGTMSLIEVDEVSGSHQLVPRRGRDVLSVAMPFLPEKFPTYRAYSEANVDAVLGEFKGQFRELAATTLQSMVFLNRSPRWEASALPREAQMAPVFAIQAGDLDGDGREDLILSQNFFATEPEVPRLDAGLGLWLRGSGIGLEGKEAKLRWEAVRPSRSGLRVWGEQRGAALADLDRDGRLDVVISQNAAETRVYRNLGARPGLRIGWRGPRENPDGVGVQLRVKVGGRWGAVREVHDGNGYRSVDGATQIMGGIGVGPVEELEVRWPGGGGRRKLSLKVPAGAREVWVGLTGLVESGVGR